MASDAQLLKEIFEQLKAAGIEVPQEKARAAVNEACVKLKRPRIVLSDSDSDQPIEKGKEKAKEPEPSSHVGKRQKPTTAPTAQVEKGLTYREFKGISGVKLSSAELERNSKWGFEALEQLANCGIADCMVLIRHIMTKLPKGTALGREKKKLVVEASMEDLQQAFMDVQKCLGDHHDLQEILCAFHVAVEYRKGIRRAFQRSKKKKSKEKTKQAEDLAEKVVKYYDGSDMKLVGLRIMIIAFVISRRSMVGVLLLPFMGLSFQRIREASAEEFICLLNMLNPFNEQGGAAARCMLDSTIAPLVDYVVGFHIPATELALGKLIARRRRQLPDTFRALLSDIEVPAAQDSFLDWGLVLAGTNKEIKMPKPFIVDGSYKTMKENKYIRIVSLYNDKIHIDSDQHRELHQKRAIVPADIETFKKYERLWQLPPMMLHTAQEYPGLPAVPEGIEAAAWREVHPLLAFWSTFLTEAEGSDVVINGRTINTHSPDFFGVIIRPTRESIKEDRQHQGSGLRRMGTLGIAFLGQTSMAGRSESPERSPVLQEAPPMTSRPESSGRRFLRSEAPTTASRPGSSRQPFFRGGSLTGSTPPETSDEEREDDIVEDTRPFSKHTSSDRHALHHPYDD